MNGHQYQHAVALCALLTKKYLYTSKSSKWCCPPQLSFCHIFLILDTLHWLPVKSCILCKILLIFKSLNNQAPSYLYNLIQLHVRSCQLCLLILDSFIFHLLTSYSGLPAFFCQVPLLWNDLPYSFWHSSSIASFQSALKTHLFFSGP